MPPYPAPSRSWSTPDTNTRRRSLATVPVRPSVALSLVSADGRASPNEPMWVRSLAARSCPNSRQSR